MKPGRADLTFWQACIVTRGAPTWARRIAAPKYAPHIHEHLNAAINARAGYKAPRGMSWSGALSLLALVRSNQSNGARSDGPRTLAGYMLQSIMQRGAGYNERRPYYRRLLARLPDDVLRAGIADLQSYSNEVET